MRKHPFKVCVKSWQQCNDKILGQHEKELEERKCR